MLEKRLHDPAVRCNAAEVALLLADEFREFGKSGRVYDKAAMLQSLADEAPVPVQNPLAQAPIESSGFVLVPVGAHAALLTYRSISAGTEALRSSLWIYRDARWQMLFNQGTKSSAS